MDLTRVYVEGDGKNKDTIEITPEYVYIAIPAKYVCLYHRILILLSQYGEESLKDCNAACTSRNKNIINCYNIFSSAIAAYKLEKTKLAETLIKYIESTINQIDSNKNSIKQIYYPVDANGEIEALITCGETPTFEIDINDGTLWENIYNEDENAVFIVDNGDLNIVE